MRIGVGEEIVWLLRQSLFSWEWDFEGWVKVEAFLKQKQKNKGERLGVKGREHNNFTTLKY